MTEKASPGTGWPVWLLGVATATMALLEMDFGDKGVRSWDYGLRAAGKSLVRSPKDVIAVPATHDVAIPEESNPRRRLPRANAT